MSEQAYAGLLERLVATESSASDFIGDPNPKYVTCWHRNPDGPEAAEAISSLLRALEEAALGFDKHARLWRASAERTDLIEDRLRAENAEALAERVRAALNSDAPLSIGEGL